MVNKEKFTFIDLFAGIGGFHIALHHLGGQCVFASEMDIAARKTYKHNFEKIAPELFQKGLFNDDIRTISPQDIPDFDILCAGFPCQPFSQAGYKRGFADNHKSERGNLFFNIVDILEVKKPAAFFLENVQGIINHDEGKTFKVIQNFLEKELGYSFYYKVVKASDYGLPQLRPRVFMIGFRDESFVKSFVFPPKIPLKFNMSAVWGGECSREIGFTLRVGGRGSKIDDRRNWDAYLVDGEVRQLGVKEGKIMQGFPLDYDFPVSKTQAIKQLGNSVAIDAVQIVAAELIKYLGSIKKSKTIKEVKKTFAIPPVKLIQDTLSASRVKDGTSYQKADIVLDIIEKQNEGFGIKSYLKSKPTLLNASGNANFIFEITNINYDKIDEINAIDSPTKLKDRIARIEQLGGTFHYKGAEKETMNYNLKMVDSLMPAIIGHILLAFYKEKISSISAIIDFIDTNKVLKNEIDYEDKQSLIVKIKKLLVAILLGFFPGTKWDGEYMSNGTIVMKNTSDCLAFHTVEMKNLKDYLYQNIKLDMPSTTRHRYGKLYKETDGKVYFKLNLQMRF